ncbi:hypothetical protein [Pedobacter sp.]|uniref:hypothetical protein n=1 Tax=Pedobacter sp. TaxID=1411316 RepID=UPI0031CE9514
MKLLAKSSFVFLLTLLFINVAFAQKKRAPFTALVFVEGSQKVHGKITAINETELVLVDKRDVSHSVAYQKINRIKVYKHRSDVGYAVITGALAAGTIAAAQSIDDANVAILVGVGGTAAVVSLSMILHNVIHGAELKIDAKKEKIDYENMSQKLSKYLVNDASLKP